MVGSRAKIALLGGLLSAWVVGCTASKSSAPIAVTPAPAPLATSRPGETSLVTPKTGAQDAPGPVQGSALGNQVVATINNDPILMSQLIGPLLEANGYATLMNIVKLKLAQQNATARGVTISEDDVAKERDVILAGLVPEAEKKDYPALLEQFLEKERLSHAEFDMLVRTQTYLRALAEPLIAKSVTDKDVLERFNVLYGETVVARHIQCSNLQEIGEAQRRIHAGEPFEKVALELSRNPQTRALGGELPAFSRQTQGLSDGFKQAAFSLQEGEVSDPVQSDNSYHLIKVEKRVPPKAVKFEDVKDEVRKNLIELATMQRQKELTTILAQQAILQLNIQNPVLKKQLDDRLKRRDSQIKDREKFREELKQGRPATTGPAEVVPAK